MSSLSLPNKVRSIESNVFIKKDNIQKLVDLIKLYYPKRTEHINSVYFVLKEFGWIARFDLPTGDIVALEYRSNKWKMDASRVIPLVARFVEPNGFIKIIDENIGSHFVVIFNEKTSRRYKLYREYINYSSEEDLFIYLNKITTAMFELGISQNKVINTIKEIHIESTMGKDE